MESDSQEILGSLIDSVRELQKELSALESILDDMQRRVGDGPASGIQECVPQT
jgi:hypothetical protein